MVKPKPEAPLQDGRYPKGHLSKMVGRDIAWESWVAAMHPFVTLCHYHYSSGEALRRHIDALWGHFPSPYQLQRLPYPVYASQQFSPRRTGVFLALGYIQLQLRLNYRSVTTGCS